jgi:hypothetical protein
MLLGLLGLTRFVAKVLPSAAALEPEGGQEEYLFYRDQLRNLGFEPLGIIESIGYFFCFHYIKRFRHRVFINHALGVYASVYQLIPGDELRVLLSTLLTDGWLVQTGCCLESLVCSEEKYYRWGTTTRIVREQLEAHQELLRSCWEEGDSVAPIELAALAERMRQTSQQLAGRWFAREARDGLALALLLLAGLAALGSVVSGWRHLLVPGGLLLGSLAYHPLMTFLMQSVARSMRQEEVEKHYDAAKCCSPNLDTEIEESSRRVTLKPECTAAPNPGNDRIRGESVS